ncbi:hypothetical protein ACFVWX_21025 [Streptomyces sp. NPDC058220]|uniref:hypothetical protein n=1 Tax=unclassified Streptomyces TaxID=2593676 RepID=UPI0036526926
MHSDVHLQLHALRADELRREAAGRPDLHPAVRPAPRAGLRTDYRAALRTRLGWTLVELGLRLVNRPAPSKARLA